MLMAMDQSVRGWAFAAAPTFWEGDWSKVVTGRFDGGPLTREAPEVQHRYRQERIFRWVYTQVCDQMPNKVGFESYAFSARPDTDVVELVGMVKHRLWEMQIETSTVNQSTARKFLLGKVPRTGVLAKNAVRLAFQAAGYPGVPTLDETDALCILNLMMNNHGGRSFGQN
jgi:hypothetical protein